MKEKLLKLSEIDALLRAKGVMPASFWIYLGNGDRFRMPLSSLERAWPGFLRWLETNGQ